MPVQTIPYPAINGNYYEFSSIELNVPGYPVSPPYGGILALQSIDYDDNMEHGELRGAAPNLLALTKGKYMAAGKLKVPKLESDTFLSVIATAAASLPTPMGYMQFSGLTITVSYYEPSLMPKPIIDRLFGFTLKKNADSHKVGQDPLYVEHDFRLFMLSRNGKYPFDPGLLGTVFGIPQTI